MLRLATAHAPLPRVIPLLDRRLQPHLDQAQHLPVHHPAGTRLHQLVVRDGVEVLRQVGVDHVRVSVAQRVMDRPDRILRAPLRSIAIGTVLEVRFEDRLQHQLGGGLHHPVPNRRDPEWSLARRQAWESSPDAPASGRYVFVLQLLPQPGQPLLPALRLDVVERHPVHAGVRAPCARARLGRRGAECPSRYTLSYSR